MLKKSIIALATASALAFLGNLIFHRVTDPS